jgi:hypothetical protein
MNTLKLIGITILIGLCVQGRAQEKQSPNVRYSIFIEDAVFMGIKHYSIEKTVFNGISIKEKHVIGIGMGIGLGIGGSVIGGNDIFYCPLYANYRYYFKTGTFAPFLNLAVGGIVLSDDIAAYSTLVAGFRKHKFTFSSGVFFHFCHEYLPFREFNYYDPIFYPQGKSGWEFPYGFIVKLGVAF